MKYAWFLALTGDIVEKPEFAVPRRRMLRQALYPQHGMAFQTRPEQSPGEQRHSVLHLKILEKRLPIGT